jgi:hypothetical protein
MFFSDRPLLLIRPYRSILYDTSYTRASPAKRQNTDTNHQSLILPWLFPARSRTIASNTHTRTLRVRLVRVSGTTRLTGCRRATFGCLHRPQSQALQMQFPSSCLHPQKRQKQPFLRSQARLMQLFLSLMMY